MLATARCLSEYYLHKLINIKDVASCSQCRGQGWGYMYTLLKKITWLLPHGQRLNTPRIGYEAIPLNPYLDQSGGSGLALCMEVSSHDRMTFSQGYQMNPLTLCSARVSNTTTPSSLSVISLLLTFFRPTYGSLFVSKFFFRCPLIQATIPHSPYLDKTPPEAQQEASQSRLLGDKVVILELRRP